MPTILAVDDEWPELEWYSTTLRPVGGVIVSEYGEKALEWYERMVTPAQFPCDLIITDGNMDRMGGLEFLAALKRQHQELPPRLMITSYTDLDLQRKIQNQGGVGILNKGHVREDPERFRTIARELIENRGVSPTLDTYYVEQRLK